MVYITFSQLICLMTGSWYLKLLLDFTSPVPNKLFWPNELFSKIVIILDF